MSGLVVVLLAYLLGSIPFGVLLTRSRGVDLRKVGSGNIGATNVLRALGWKAALLTLLGDLIKGLVSVIIAKGAGVAEWAVVAAGTGAVIGHVFPVYLKFRGGKGVATSIGVLLGYHPPAGLLVIGIWIVMAYLFRYSSLSALVSFTLLPLFMALSGKTPEGLVLSLGILTLIIIKHRDNIRRLVEGKEPKIGHRI